MGSSAGIEVKFADYAAEKSEGFGPWFTELGTRGQTQACEVVEARRPPRSLFLPPRAPGTIRGAQAEFCAEHSTGEALGAARLVLIDRAKCQSDDLTFHEAVFAEGNAGFADAGATCTAALILRRRKECFTRSDAPFRAGWYVTAPSAGLKVSVGKRARHRIVRDRPATAEGGFLYVDSFELSDVGDLRVSAWKALLLHPK